jgi:hypothetical protein
MQTQELQFESILQNSPINAFKEVSKNVSFANVRACMFHIASRLLSANTNYYIFMVVHHICCSQCLNIPY